MAAKKRARADIKALERQREEAIREIEVLRRELESGEVDPSEDEADPDVVEREKTVALVAALEARLEEVIHAIEQAEAGAYGICEVCGQAIDPERLAIMPEATMCVSCKSALEKRRSAAARVARSIPDDW
jgi:RNA polymerase-binding transcription factor DksA